jgi:hypothetical protein
MSTKLEKYYKTIPTMYKPGVNTFVTALLKAIAGSDELINTAIEEAGKQIFVSTAEGKYLDGLGSNVGVIRPLAVNLSDDKFRELIPILSYNPKQIKNTMYKLLDVFWGPLYSRANITSLAYAPYNLGAVTNIAGTVSFQNGSLSVAGSGTTFIASLSVGDYIKFSSHDNEYFGRISKINSNISLYLDSEYSGASVTGTCSKYTPLTLTLIIDALDENSVKIPPNLIEDTQNVTAEEFVETLNDQMNTSATTGTITASIVTDYINDLNYVNIRTDSTGSYGSIRITNGSANIFANGAQNFNGNSVFVSNAEGSLFTVGFDVVVGSDVGSIDATIADINIDTPTAGITEIVVDELVDAYIQSNNNYIYKKGHFGFRDQEVLITNLQLYTSIYEIENGELIVRIPATVPALRRALSGSVHPRSNWYGSITDIDNVLKQVEVDFLIEPVVEDFHVGRTFATSLVESVIVSHPAGQTGVVIQLESDADLSSLIIGDTFTLLDENYRSAYIFDPDNSSFTATSQRCILDQTINKGSIYPKITVDYAENIPNESGYIIFNFGRTTQEQPVLYRSRPNNNTLLLDPAYIFSKNHYAGEMINVLALPLTGTTPRITGNDYAFYVTGTEEARQTVEDLLNEIKAAGVTITFIIDFPDYLWTTGRPSED